MSSTGTIEERASFYSCAKDYKTNQQFKGTFTYNLKKGVYYVAVSKGMTSTSASFTVDFKAAEIKTNSSAKKTEYMTITLKKGDSVQLGYDTTDTLKWSSSKEKVASVTSGGKITAKSKGTATITVQKGSKKIKIKVIVE